MSNGAVRKKGGLTASLDTKARRSPLHITASHPGLSATYFCAMDAVSSWCFQSVPKPAAVAAAHTAAAGTAVLRLPSLSLALCLKENFWAEWEKKWCFNFDFLYCGSFFRRKEDCEAGRMGNNINISFPRIWRLIFHGLSQNPWVFHYRVILHLVQLSQIIPVKYGTIICIYMQR